MGLIRNFIESWKEKRRIEAAARMKLLLAFSAFIEETYPLTPKAEKYPEAALYRHAWKRAVALEDIAVASNSADEVEQYRKFQKLAGSKYYEVAPDNIYGKVRLSLNVSARERLAKEELARIVAEKNQTIVLRGVVYLLKSGPNYKIGQTTNMNRRLNQLKIQLPDPVTVEHTIQTNDPLRIEKYWHRHFAHRRKNGEWFELSDEEVTEFKMRIRM